jgi:hypothetical protein
MVLGHSTCYDGKSSNCPDSKEEFLVVIFTWTNLNFFFLTVPGFELRTLCLLDRCFTA